MSDTIITESPPYVHEAWKLFDIQTPDGKAMGWDFDPFDSGLQESICWNIPDRFSVHHAESSVDWRKVGEETVYHIDAIGGLTPEACYHNDPEDASMFSLNARRSAVLAAIREALAIIERSWCPKGERLVSNRNLADEITKAAATSLWLLLGEWTAVCSQTMVDACKLHAILYAWRYAHPAADPKEHDEQSRGMVEDLDRQIGFAKLMGCPFVQALLQRTYNTFVYGYGFPFGDVDDEESEDSTNG